MAHEQPLSASESEITPRKHVALFRLAALILLLGMGLMSGRAALRESVTVDEVAHIGAGVSYLQKFDLRLNEEHPPLPKILAALPLIVRGVRADYSHISWSFSDGFFQAYMAQWVFGDYLLTKWNNPGPTIAWARLPMLLVTLTLGWAIFVCARRIGGDWAGLLCLAIYVSTPAFLAFGPLVHTDMSVTLFSLLTLWSFAEIWREPSRKNTGIFALCFAGALLSKFTAGILLFAFAAFGLSTRWRPVSGQPTTKPEARGWRRARRWATLRGIFWAAIAVYIFYFIFSLGQPSDVVSRVGHGNGLAVLLLRRLLMPPWLYLRGVLLVFFTASRPTYILGHAYSHGVWFYFPTLFVLKSTLGFLGLLALTLALALSTKRNEGKGATIVPAEVGIQWRVLWVSLLMFTCFCLLSRLDISIRHFSVPMMLLILLLAPLPLLAGRPRATAPSAARGMMALAAVFAASSLFTAVRTYPYYFPYVNALSMGRPAYALVNDSNLDWNQSLPEVKRFAEEPGMQKINLDDYGMNDPTPFVPQSQVWDCQNPSPSDAGQWVAVSAGMILDGHNCRWLQQYPHEKLAGGAMYVFHLPANIPAAGSAGGPPPASADRNFGGAPFDLRGFSLSLDAHPETLPEAYAAIMAVYSATPPTQNGGK